MWGAGDGENRERSVSFTGIPAGGVIGRGAAGSEAGVGNGDLCGACAGGVGFGGDDDTG